MFIAKRSLAAWQICLMFVVISPVALACVDRVWSPASKIFFLQQKVIEGEREYMEASFSGEMVLVNDCLRVNSNETGTSYLIFWPSDFSLSTEGDAIKVLNGAGQVVARVGGQTRLGGGEVPKDAAVALSERLLPEECSGPYWIVGEVLIENIEEFR